MGNWKTGYLSVFGSLMARIGIKNVPSKESIHVEETSAFAIAATITHAVPASHTLAPTAVRHADPAHGKVVVVGGFSLPTPVVTDAGTPHGHWSMDLETDVCVTRYSTPPEQNAYLFTRG